MEMELSFFSYIYCFWLKYFFVIIYFRILLCSKALGYEILSKLCIQTFFLM